MTKIFQNLKLFLKNKYFILGSLFLFALLPRLVWLNKFPVGVTNDELDYIFNAKSIFLSGTDVLGDWKWWSLAVPSSKTVAVAELTSLLLSPFIGPMPFGLFNSKYIFALIGSFSVILWYGIFKKLLNKETAYIGALVLALNPWSIHFSRTAFEAPISLFFYSLSIWIILSYKSNYKFLAVIPLILGFFTYHGTKLLAVPLIVMVSAFVYLQEVPRDWKKFWLINFIVLALFVIYLMILYPTSDLKNRSTELILNNPNLSVEVDTQRKFSIYNSFNSLVINKPSLIFSKISDNYLQAFNLSRLFITGEALSFFSYFHHGYFYFFEIVFLVIGILWGIKYRNKFSNFLLLLSLGILAPLPASLSGQTYVLRAGLLFPIFCGLIATGIYIVFWKAIKKNLKAFFFILIIMFYIFSFGFYTHNYYLRYPIYAGSGFGLNQRIVSNYIQRIFYQNQTNKVILVSTEPRAFLDQFIFYNSPNFNDEDLKNYREQIQKQSHEIQYEWHRLTIQGNCPESVDQETIVIADRLFECNINLFNKTNLPETHIKDISDAGVVYKVYQSNYCDPKDLKSYTLPAKLSDFDLNSLSSQQFCSTWIALP